MNRKRYKARLDWYDVHGCLAIYKFLSHLAKSKPKFKITFKAELQQSFSTWFYCMRLRFQNYKKVPPTFYQKSELRVTLKKGTYCNYILVWGNQLLTTQTFLLKLTFLQKQRNKFKICSYIADKIAY